MYKRQDADSISAYGQRTLERIDLLIATDAEVLAQAEYLLSRYKDPMLRVSRLIIRPDSDPANLMPMVLGFDLSTRITVKLPEANIDGDYFIEGIEHQFTVEDDLLWETFWELSPIDVTGDYWCLGVAGYTEIGLTTRLFY